MMSGGVNAMWGPDYRLPGKTLSRDGHRLFYLDRGEGTPIVLLHGLGWDTSLWFATMARFAGHCRLIALDTRGHGQSTLPDGRFSISDLAGDVEALLRHLGVAEFALAGFSQGGMTAQSLAVRMGEACKGLLVAGAGSYFPPAAQQVMEGRIVAFSEEGADGAADAAAASIFSDAFRDGHPDLIARFKAWRVSVDQQALLRCTEALFGFDNREYAAAITAPSYVAIGDADRLASVAAARALAQSLPDLRRFDVLPAGHMLPVEQPDRFADLFATFLNDVCSPASSAAGHP